VRREIEAALGRPRVQVIPVLLHEAELPAEHDLPESLRPLCRRQALAIPRAYFRQGVERLLKRLCRIPALEFGTPPSEDASSKLIPPDSGQGAAQALPVADDRLGSLANASSDPTAEELESPPPAPDLDGEIEAARGDHFRPNGRKPMAANELP